MPALGSPIKPTSAMTFNSRVIQRSSPGWPFSTLARGPIGRRLEMGVAVSSAAAARDDHLVAGRFQVAQQMATVAITNQGPGRNLDDHVLAAATEAIRALAMLAAVGFPMALVREVGQVGVTFGSANHDAAAVAPITAVGPAPRCVFLPAKTEAAVAPSPSSHKDRDAVDEHASSFWLTLQRSSAAGFAFGITLIRRPSWSNRTSPAISE